MFERLNELLNDAVDVALRQQHTADVNGHWRGTADLAAFAERFPGREAQEAAGEVPRCVVMVEYARWALSNRAPDEATEFLKQQANRILEDSDSGSRTDLIRAIASAVIAAALWKQRDMEGVCTHLPTAAEAYEWAWPIPSQRVAKAPGNPIDPDQAGPDLSVAGGATQILDVAEKCGAFGEEGITVTIWLTLHRLLSGILGERNSKLSPPQCMKVLLFNAATGEGFVQPIRIERISLPHPGIYCDPLSFGVTHLDRSLLNSLQVAWRCCRQSVIDDLAALRLEADLPLPLSQLGGPSAGGLFAAAMIATGRGQKLDSTRSATCELAITDSRLKHDEQQPLHPHDLAFKSVGGVVSKIDEAWQRAHGIEEVFLCEADAKKWHKANPNCTRPRVTPVGTLHELVDRLTTNRKYDRELERLAGWQHGEWERGKAAVRDDSIDDANRDHRFDCYVDPTFRVEGPLREREKPESDGSDEMLRRLPGGERDEFVVPGNDENDQQLLNLLELSFRGTPWPGSPEWLKPKRHIVLYDNAGAGKTVCSHRMLHLLTNRKHWERLSGHEAAPLVVRLNGRWRREFDTEGRLLTIPELLCQIIRQEAEISGDNQTELVEDTVAHALREHRVVLILDGFDQFLEEDRQHVVTVFNRHSEAKQCRWIITSRVHTIDELRSRNHFFLDSGWMRVRMDPFSEEQQAEYFHREDANGKTIGDRWQTMVDVTAMSDLLGLPMVLWMLRVLIDEADRRGEPLPVFHSLSQLYLVTSRKLLARALEKNGGEVAKRLTDKNIPVPTVEVDQQLQLLEHVLTLMAFQLMLMEEYNGRVDGREQVERFEKLCRQRFLYDLRREFEQADEFDKDDVRQKKQRMVDRWNWAVEVLKTIELNHRSVTEAYNPTGLAFRSRKMLECHAARYMTRYATDSDVFAGRVVDDMPVVDPQDDDQNLSTLCAWNYTTHPQWKETWELAIDMPQEPISATDHDGVIADAVINHEVTCRSLSALFELPKRYTGRDIRPTALIYRAWHLFEYDERSLRERFFAVDGQSVAGGELPAEELQRRGEQLLLGARAGRQSVCRHRENVLKRFRATGIELRKQIAARLDTVLLNDGSRVPIPYSAAERNQVLAEWQQQSSLEKSLTFVQCPPQEWMEAFEKLPADQRTPERDPRVNAAIEGHAGDVVHSFRIQATTVTRAMYRVFDPAFETSQAEPDWGDGDLAATLERRASAFNGHPADDEFPVICSNWYDAWVFCKWLGPEYRLPTEIEWEHACRAGTKTLYHFGDGLNGTLANCDGNNPYGTDETGEPMEQGPCVERTTPVGLSTYPCNAYGLFDTHGNVWEWSAERRDPADSSPGSSRVLRGGSWLDYADYCRSAYRFNCGSPDFRGSDVGFRVCCE